MYSHPSSATGSAKIAAKQHAELVNTLDLIEVLPPGLYEMILEEKKAEDVGADLHDTGSMGCRARGSEKSSFRRQSPIGVELDGPIDRSGLGNGKRSGTGCVRGHAALFGGILQTRRSPPEWGCSGRSTPEWQV
jgi:hypothetical protein